jgi:ACS family tartrate transporter-like MFS transporter
MGDPLATVVRRKVTLRLLPFLFLLYVFNILDRVNVSFARLDMLSDLGMSEQAYAFGAGLFYIGYFVFEVPSNLILHRVGARRWIARILVSWGAVSCAMMVVQDEWSFYALRMLLGVAEAGFFPGIILYLTYWYPARWRAQTVACFMAAAPLAGILGNPLSGIIMDHMDQVAGLRGWQWLFLLEGAPTVLLGVIVLCYLTDRPEQASWLSPEERDWLAAELSQEETVRQRHHGLSSWRALGDPRVWLLIVLYFTVAAGTNTMGLYLPKLIEGLYPEATKTVIGRIAALPSLFALVVMIIVGTHSDRTGERRWHVAGAAFVSAFGWFLSGRLASPVLCVCALIVAHAGMMSMLPVFWSLPTALLSGTAAAGGIAFINSVGNLGGFAGPNILGQLVRGQDDFSVGLAAMAGLMFAGGVAALLVPRTLGRDAVK